VPPHLWSGHPPIKDVVRSRCEHPGQLRRECLLPSIGRRTRTRTWKCL